MIGRSTVPLRNGAAAVPRSIQQQLSVQHRFGRAVSQPHQLRHREDQGRLGWRVSLALAAVPAALLTLGALFLPETPNSLIQQGKADRRDVANLLQRIRGCEDVGAELDDLIAASDAAAKIPAGRRQFEAIARREYRPQLVMAVMIPFFQQVTGINVIAFYAPILFRTVAWPRARRCYRQSSQASSARALHSSR
uniref:Major facilitator superfamily (MFS) profile domain-containing protein n=1 Tax=Ananas comosus var. bracteatus TaxID=296719 RepID=A0A6V7Q231_ANACO|nr:unnamed protein product [Ananas comosus var. bracteatus]